MDNEQYKTDYYKIKDESEKGFSNLSLFIGNQLFMFAVFNESFTSVLEICHIKISGTAQNDNQLAEKIRFLISNYRLDQRTFKNVNLSILNSQFTLVPEAYDLNDNVKKLLDFTTGSEKTKSSFIHKTDQLNFCYTITEDLLPYLERTFKNATIRHAGVVTIDLLMNNSSVKNADLLLNFNNGIFEIAAKKQNKLIYYNVFHYEINEDVLYYLLFMMEQCEFNPLTCKLVIAGQMDTEGELVKAIKKYIKHVSFAVNDKTFSSSFAGLKLPDHYFFSLTNQHLCVS